MLDGIVSNQFLEYGTHEEAMYGTKIDTIKDIIADQKVPILDVEPQVTKLVSAVQSLLGIAVDPLILTV